MLVGSTLISINLLVATCLGRRQMWTHRAAHLAIVEEEVEDFKMCNLFGTFTLTGSNKLIIRD